MRTELIRIQKMLKATFVYVTHDQVEAMTMATKICIMNEGKILQIGSPSEIYEKPKSTFVANFIANPVNNIYKTKILSKENSIFFEIFDCETEKFNNQISKFNEAFLSIRPEHIYLEKKENTINIKTTLEIVENLGHEKILCVEIKKTKKLFYLRTNSQNNFNIGKEIEIYIDINKILFFDPNNNNLIEG